jgi:hypothetical protein
MRLFVVANFPLVANLIMHVVVAVEVLEMVD